MESDFAPVSVIIPCYRASATIRRALDSVLAQTQQPSEIILVDDYSQDGTLDVLRLLSERQGEGRIRVLALSENTGPGGARNAGWRISTQSFVAFLDADDSWHPQKLELQLRCLSSYSDVMLVGSEAAQGQNYCVGQGWNSGTPPRFVKAPLLLLSNPFVTSSVMVKRSAPFRFQESKRYSEDYLLWAQLVLGGERACIIPVPLTYSHKRTYGQSSLSSHLWRMEKGELDTYVQLQNDGLINIAQLLACCVFSLLKFARRLLLSAMAR